MHHLVYTVQPGGGGYRNEASVYICTLGAVEYHATENITPAIWSENLHFLHTNSLPTNMPCCQKEFRLHVVHPMYNISFIDACLFRLKYFVLVMAFHFFK